MHQSLHFTTFIAFYASACPQGHWNECTLDVTRQTLLPTGHCHLGTPAFPIRGFGASLICQERFLFSGRHDQTCRLQHSETIDRCHPFWRQKSTEKADLQEDLPSSLSEQNPLQCSLQWIGSRCLPLVIGPMREKQLSSQNNIHFLGLRLFVI